MAETQQHSPLSPSDIHILDSVFDPESKPADASSVSIDSNLPADPHIASQKLISSLKEREIQAIRLIESCRPEPSATQKDEVYRAALDMLSKLIEEYPKYASPYNNRAQLRRWRYGDHLPLSQLSNAPLGTEGGSNQRNHITAIAEALADLTTAITLATPPTQGAAVSPAQAKLLANAWTQRAAIFYTLSKDLAVSHLDHLPSVIADFVLDAGGCGKPKWLSWDRARFEEEGSRCFFMAGAYGSEVGKRMAVVSNPYARLCGAIVKEAMRREVTAGVTGKV
jgi:hypothetical protein